MTEGASEVALDDRSELDETVRALIEDEDVEAEDLMTFGRLMSFAKRKSLT